MHVYLFARVRATEVMPHAAIIPFVLFLLLMVSAPMIVRYAERANLEMIARISAWIGYLWLGWLLLFCSFSFVYDIYRGIISAAGLLFHRNRSDMVLTPVHAFLLPLVLSLAAAAYGYFEAGNIRTEHLQI